MPFLLVHVVCPSMPFLLLVHVAHKVSGHELMHDSVICLGGSLHLMPISMLRTYAQLQMRTTCIQMFRWTVNGMQLPQTHPSSGGQARALLEFLRPGLQLSFWASAVLHDITICYLNAFVHT